MTLDSITRGALAFKRDFYLCTAEEMLQRWLSNKSKRQIARAIEPALSETEGRALDRKFETHNPLWEYAHIITFDGTDFDPLTNKKVNLAEFYLDRPVHKDLICDPILRYMMKPAPRESGLAIFVERYAVKTYLAIINTISWSLTRQRILFDDFTTSRIIHEVEDRAIDRGEEVKRLHMHNKNLRALYPECALPIGSRWMEEKEWDLVGRAASKTLDPQVRCIGAQTKEQGSHPFLNCFDDLEGVDAQTSEASRERGKTLFAKFKYSTKIGMSRNLLVGTFYHPAGVHSTMAEVAEDKEKTGPQWTVIRLPGILDEGTEKERALLPKRLSIPILHEMRDEEIETIGNDLNWRMQIMLDFKASAAIAFKPDCWQLIDLERPATEWAKRIAEALDSALVIVQADYAWKDDESRGRGDSNASLVCAYPLIDGEIHRVLMDAHVDDISDDDTICGVTIDQAATYSAQLIVAEEAVAHHPVGKKLTEIAAKKGKRYFQRIERQKQTGNIITLVPRRMAARGIGAISTWKMARMMKMQGDFNDRRMWINEAIDLAVLDVLRGQLFGFPFIKNDDVIDAASMADDERVGDKMPAPRIKPRPLGPRDRLKRRDYFQPTKYTGLRIRR